VRDTDTNPERNAGDTYPVTDRYTSDPDTEPNSYNSAPLGYPDGYGYGHSNSYGSGYSYPDS
jgi:hypothetical protein